MVGAAELKEVPLFGALADEDLERLAAVADTLDIPEAGVDVTRQGEFGHSVLAIVEGAAVVTVDGQEVRRLERGDVFGEIAVMSSGRRTATVTSSTPMRLVSLFKRDLWKLAELRPEFGEALRRVTAAEA